jgi:hypothetical protein
MSTTETVRAWQTTNAGNAAADAAIASSDSQFVNTIDDNVRSIMVAVRKGADDTGGKLIAGGTANALTVTTGQVLEVGQLVNGLRLLVRATAANTLSAVTFAPDGLTAVPLVANDGTLLSVGAIQAGANIDMVYNAGSSQWQASNLGGLGGTAVAAYRTPRNKLINGAMVIDQRNAGAFGSAAAYTVDRWSYAATQASKGNWQQGASNSAPGFSNFLTFASTSAYALAAGDTFIFFQRIEAANFGESQWGTAGAVPATLSFWATASIAGTYGGSLKNAALNRSYPFSFTLPATTWTYVTIVIPGDTTGTWASSGNAFACQVSFSLGTGATFSGAAGAWIAGQFNSVSGCVSVVGTNAAQFNITGVQFEFGSVATPYERQSIGELTTACQRYYQKYLNASGANASLCAAYGAAGGIILSTMLLSAPMRAVPVTAPIGTWTLNNCSGSAILAVSQQQINVFATVTALGSASIVLGATAGFSLDAEL